MQEPTYKPGTWVTFSRGNTGGFGEIIGGFYTNNEWHYHVKNAEMNAGTAQITGKDIQFTFEGGNWMKPNYTVGNSSIYAQVEE